MMKVFIFALICWSFSGCTSISSFVTSDSADLPVRIINEELAKNCKFVGVATGHAYNPFKSEDDNKFEATLIAAKEAFSQGGNAVVINYSYVEHPSNYAAVNMDVCNCSE